MSDIANSSLNDGMDSLNIREGNSGPQLTKDKKLSEVQNIAYHVQPPTVAAQRPAPLENDLKRSDPFQFGSRYLEENDDVFSWNAWDHVDPSKDPLFVSYSEAQYAFQKEHAVNDFDRQRFNHDPEKWWNKFYSNNSANFFKDRKWLRQEFPVLSAATTSDLKDAEATMQEVGASEDSVREALQTIQNGPWNTILEVGAGAGNTAFPLVRNNRNQKLMVHACDFSAKAVDVIKASAEYNVEHLTASQWDMASDTLPEGVTPGSIDIVVMVFAFSALSPTQWTQAVRNIWQVLRPGGEVCFRDYGRGDLAQVRFRKNRLLSENFYVRGDGTRVYFFEEEQLRKIWSGDVVAEADLATEKPDTKAEVNEGNLASTSEQQPPKESDAAVSSFEIVSVASDRRLLVNRQKQLKMYRCWLQGRFRKPLS